MTTIMKCGGTTNITHILLQARDKMTYRIDYTDLENLDESDIHSIESYHGLLYTIRGLTMIMN